MTNFGTDADSAPNHNRNEQRSGGKRNKKNAGWGEREPAKHDRNQVDTIRHSSGDPLHEQVRKRARTDDESVAELVLSEGIHVDRKKTAQNFNEIRLSDLRRSREGDFLHRGPSSPAVARAIAHASASESLFPPEQPLRHEGATQHFHGSSSCQLMSALAECLRSLVVELV